MSVSGEHVFDVVIVWKINDGPETVARHRIGTAGRSPACRRVLESPLTLSALLPREQDKAGNHIAWPAGASESPPVRGSGTGPGHRSGGHWCRSQCGQAWGTVTVRP